jgi:hypothetical protein|tara:strand:+ start:132 stop:374 length:243 start_codon:yes stop_codon:yes gene_type:complete
MRTIRNKFKVGDLVIDNDSGITGIVLELRIQEPNPDEQWWAPTNNLEATIQYKVRLFRDAIKESYYEEFRLTRLSTGKDN